MKSCGRGRIIERAKSNSGLSLDRQKILGKEEGPYKSQFLDKLKASRLVATRDGG